MANNQRFEALRKLSCVECGSRPVDIAHSNFSEHGKGKGVTMGYSEPKKVICRRTGEVIGSNYVPRKIDGKKKGVQFYSFRTKQTERMSKDKFDLIYRVEDCK